MHCAANRALIAIPLPASLWRSFETFMFVVIDLKHICLHANVTASGSISEALEVHKVNPQAHK